MEIVFGVIFTVMFFLGVTNFFKDHDTKIDPSKLDDEEKSQKLKDTLELMSEVKKVWKAKYGVATYFVSLTTFPFIAASVVWLRYFGLLSDTLQFILLGLLTLSGLFLMFKKLMVTNEKINPAEEKVSKELLISSLLNLGFAAYGVLKFLI